MGKVLFTFLLWGALAHAEPCQLFNSTLASGRSSEEVLPVATWQLAQILRDHAALSPDEFQRLVTSPFDFPLANVRGSEFRDALEGLQRIYRAHSDQPAIEKKTRKLLAPYIAAVALTTQAHDQGASYARGIRPALVVVAAQIPAFFGNGTRYTNLAGALYEHDGRPVPLPNAIAEKFREVLPIDGSDTLLVRTSENDWTVRLVDSHTGRETKLSHSPFPYARMNALFLGRTAPARMSATFSPDGKTVLVMGDSIITHFGFSKPRFATVATKAALYDVANGKQIAVLPQLKVQDEVLPQAHGASWLNRNMNVFWRGSENEILWFKDEKSRLFSWNWKQENVAIDHGSYVDRGGYFQHRFQYGIFGDVFPNREGNKVAFTLGDSRYPRRHEFHSHLDATPLTFGANKVFLSRDARWLVTVSPSETGNRNQVEIHDLGDPSRQVIAHELPEGVRFAGFTPDSTRIALSRAGTTALYSLSPEIAVEGFIFPTEWKWGGVR